MAEDWREVTAEWQGELSFRGENQSGGNVQMGSLAGTPGISPMEMLLLGLAGCTGMDVASILPKMQQRLTGLQVHVRGKRAEQHPRIFNEIEVRYDLWGDKLEARQVEMAISLSEEKYCSASAMLRSAATVRSSYVIHQVEPAATSAGS